MFAAFVGVWTELVTFFVSLFSSITAIFVTTAADGAVSLTFVGVCAVIMAGVALLLLAKYVGHRSSDITCKTVLTAGKS